MTKIVEKLCVLQLYIIAFSLPFDFSLQNLHIFLPLVKTFLTLELCALLLLWELAIIFEKKIPAKGAYLFVPFAIFFIIHIFSSVFPSERMIWSLKYTFRFFGFGIIAFAVINFIDTGQRRARLLASLFAGACVAALFVVIQYFWPYFLSGPQRFFEDAAVSPQRIRGLFGWPTIMSVYFGTLIPLLMSELICAPERRMRGKTGIALLIVLFFVCLILSKTRGWIIGLFCGAAGLWAIYMFKRKDYKLFWTAMVIAVVLSVLLFGSVAFSNYLQKELEPSELDRMVLAKKALVMIKEYPIRGYGADMFYWVSSQYRHSHNIFLETTANLGIFGLFTLLWLFGVIFFKLGKEIAHQHDMRVSYVQIGIFSSLVSFLGHNQVDYFLRLHEIIGLFWLLVGIGLCTVVSEARK